METPLLKGAGQEKDQPSPSNYGSTRQSQNVSIRNDQGVGTENAQEVGAENDQDVDIEKEQDFGTENAQAASTKCQVVDMLNEPNGEDGNGAKSQYSTRKNITQGLLTGALLTANASQLRTIMDAGSSNPYFYPLMVLIILSMLLQVVAGALMVYVAKCDMKTGDPHAKCKKMNTAVAILVFLVTAVNVIVPVFGPQQWQQPAMKAP